MSNGSAYADARLRACELLKSNLVWDNHACMPLRPADRSFLPQLERFRAVGADVVSLNIGYGEDSLESHFRMVASFRQWIAENADRYCVVSTTSGIDQAVGSGKLAVTFDIEGMAILNQGDHGLIEAFYDLGVRWMLIAYNRNNVVGGGCHDVDAGLTTFGRDVLAEMKRVGMVVCCSHTGHRTAHDVIAAADNPVIFSHSNPSALARHARNIPDDLIDACARSGGVIGINGIGWFLGHNAGRPENVAACIDHVVQRVGPDHAAISLDFIFDQEEMTEILATRRNSFPDPAAYAGELNILEPEGLPDVVANLLLKGYGDGDIAKVLGGNWRRVADQVWR